MEVIKSTEICENALVSLRSCVVARLSRKSNKGALTFRAYKHFGESSQTYAYVYRGRPRRGICYGIVVTSRCSIPCATRDYVLPYHNEVHECIQRFGCYIHRQGLICATNTHIDGTVYILLLIIATTFHKIPSETPQMIQHCTIRKYDPYCSSQLPRVYKEPIALRTQRRCTRASCA